MTRIRFIAEKGNRRPDDVTILLEGMEDIPKFLPVHAENSFLPIANGKVFIEDGQLFIEAELSEEYFRMYPSIVFESIEEENIEGNVRVTRSILQNVLLQTVPNIDPEILSLDDQLNSGEALLMYY